MQTKTTNPIKEGLSWLWKKIGKWVTCSTGEVLAQQVTQGLLKGISNYIIQFGFVIFFMLSEAWIQY